MRKTRIGLASVFAFSSAAAMSFCQAIFLKAPASSLRSDSFLNSSNFLLSSSCAKAAHPSAAIISIVLMTGTYRPGERAVSGIVGYNLAVRLFLDIETLPVAPEMRDAWRSTLKDPEEDEEEAYARTSLSGDFGRLLCIGYWREPGMDAPDCLTGDEPSMLKRFWEMARGTRLYVGHNVLDFDLPFLVKRSIVHRVHALPISFARYRRDPVFDTMREWGAWGRNHASLDTLAKALGLRSSKGAIDGSKVAELHEAGRDAEIVAYCKDDVRLVREVYQRMTFEA